MGCKNMDQQNRARSFESFVNSIHTVGWLTDELWRYDEKLTNDPITNYTEGGGTAEEIAVWKAAQSMLAEAARLMDKALTTLQPERKLGFEPLHYEEQPIGQ